MAGLPHIKARRRFSFLTVLRAGACVVKAATAAACNHELVSVWTNRNAADTNTLGRRCR